MRLQHEIGRLIQAEVLRISRSSPTQSATSFPSPFPAASPPVEGGNRIIGIRTVMETRFYGRIASAEIVPPSDRTWTAMSGFVTEISVRSSMP
jgi:hypothetical protein